MAARGALFSVGDVVVFKSRGRDLAGTVAIVDYQGRESVCFKGCDWSYDIMVEESPDFGGSRACTNTSRSAMYGHDELPTRFLP